MFYKILFVVIFLSSCFQKEHESKDSRSGSPNDNQIIQQQDDLPPLITDEESNDSHSGTSNNNQTQDNFPPVISGDQNIDFGHQYFNDTYNISNRFLAPELPNGCSIFDETYYVNAVTGNDSNAGTNNQFPVQTINQALTLSSSSLCTLITVSPGTYKEVLTFKYGQKNKTTIFGEDRDNTVLLSKKDLTGWTKLIDQECPDSTPCDIYRKSFNEDLGSTHHMHYKDHLLVPVNVLAKYGFREVAIETDLVSNSLPNDDDGDGHPDLYISEREKLTITGRTNYKNYALKTMMTNANALEYENSVRIKMNDLSFNGIKALFFIHVNTTNEEANGNGSEQSTIYFRALDGELNPENYLSEHIMYSIYISDSEDIVIQNLTIKNGRYNIAVSRNSHNVKVIGNIIEGGYRNVYIFGGVVGASEYHAPSNILVEGNKITNKPALPSNPQHPGHYRNFFMTKLSLTDIHGVNLLNVGDNIEIKNNFIYDVGNGIQSWTTDKVNYVTSNLRVHHNLIINTFDDGIEPGGSCKGCKWYSNHIRNSAQAIRLKISDWNSDGPVYIYGNITINNDTPSLKENGKQFINSQTALYHHTGSVIPVYIYNNAFFDSRCYIQPTGGNVSQSGENLYLINNIFSCKYSPPNLALSALPRFEILNDKNRQPLLSNNWIGGEHDERTKNSLGTKDLYEDYLMFIRHPSNLVERSSPGEEGTHYYDSFDKNANTQFLSRKNFCLNMTDYPLTATSGLDISNVNNLSWNFNDDVTYDDVLYQHEINRSISTPLPGFDFDDGDLHIGPFPSISSDCSDLSWLSN